MRRITKIVIRIRIVVNDNDKIDNVNNNYNNSDDNNDNNNDAQNAHAAGRGAERAEPDLDEVRLRSAMPAA